MKHMVEKLILYLNLYNKQESNTVEMEENLNKVNNAWLNKKKFLINLQQNSVNQKVTLNKALGPDRISTNYCRFFQEIFKLK